MIVELIYDADCPNVPATRSRLIKAFTQTGVSARWQEWERSAPDTPDHARAYGSPTMLVNGRDIAGVAPNAGTRACRVYSDAQGKLSGMPAIDLMCSALLSAGRPVTAVVGRWQAMAASFPAVGAALLPKLTCPLCFPAYAAILSALGIEFLDYTPYLLPLTATFLAVAIGVLALQTRRTGNIVPLAVGSMAAFIVLFAKFGLEIDWLSTGGIIMLVAAIFLGSRTKSAATASCPACPIVKTDSSAQAHY